MFLDLIIFIHVWESVKINDVIELNVIVEIIWINVVSMNIEDWCSNVWINSWNRRSKQCKTFITASSAVCAAIALILCWVIDKSSLCDSDDVNFRDSWMNEN